MQNKKTLIAIILCIGAVISLIYGITAGPKAKRQTAPISEVISQDKAVSPARHIIPTKRRAAKTDFVSWSRNPFVPKRASAKKVVTKFILNGIMWDKENPLAIINDEVVKIGAKIGENTVVDIKEDGVILNDGINNFELRLGEGK